MDLERGAACKEARGWIGSSLADIDEDGIIITRFDLYKLEEIVFDSKGQFQPLSSAGEVCGVSLGGIWMTTKLHPRCLHHCVFCMQDQRHLSAACKVKPICLLQGQTHLSGVSAHLLLRGLRRPARHCLEQFCLPALILLTELNRL